MSTNQLIVLNQLIKVTKILLNGNASKALLKMISTIHTLGEKFWPSKNFQKFQWSQTPLIFAGTSYIPSESAFSELLNMGSRIGVHVKM